MNRRYFFKALASGLVVEDIHHSSPIDGESISCISGRLVTSEPREVRQVVSKEVRSMD